jgi:hypothetical protein
MSPALGERRRLCGLRSTVPVTRLPILVLSVSVCVCVCVLGSRLSLTDPLICVLEYLIARVCTFQVREPQRPCDCPYTLPKRYDNWVPAPGAVLGRCIATELPARRAVRTVGARSLVQRKSKTLSSLTVRSGKGCGVLPTPERRTDRSALAATPSRSGQQRGTLVPAPVQTSVLPRVSVTVSRDSDIRSTISVSSRSAHRPVPGDGVWCAENSLRYGRLAWRCG